MTEELVGIARDALAEVGGGSRLSPSGAPSLLSTAEPSRSLAESIDPLGFASPRVAGSQLGDDSRVQIGVIDRRRLRRLRVTVSTSIVISSLADSDAPGLRVVRRRA
jgi:hypothetical protein